MRRFLKIFRSIGRSRDAKKAAESSPIDHSALRAAQHPPSKAVASKEVPKLAEVMKARKRHRWQTPDLDGPEFGGLIERRQIDTRGLMPEKYEAEPAPEHQERGPSTLGKDPGHVNEPRQADEDEDTASTGVFLSALDNSAITLADSGMFKIRAEDGEKIRRDGRFGPYGDD